MTRRRLIGTLAIVIVVVAVGSAASKKGSHGISAARSSTSAPAHAAATPTTASTTTASAKQAVRSLADPYGPGSRLDLAYQRGKAECGYLRYGPDWSMTRAIRTVRAETQTDFKEAVELGCLTAYK